MASNSVCIEPRKLPRLSFHRLQSSWNTGCSTHHTNCSCQTYRSHMCRRHRQTSMLRAARRCSGHQRVWRPPASSVLRCTCEVIDRSLARCRSQSATHRQQSEPRPHGSHSRESDNQTIRYWFLQRKLRPKCRTSSMDLQRLSASSSDPQRCRHHRSWFRCGCARRHWRRSRHRMQRGRRGACMYVQPATCSTFIKIIHVVKHFD